MEVIQNKDITCVFLLKWSNAFDLRMRAVARQHLLLEATISHERYIVCFQVQKHFVAEKLLVCINHLYFGAVARETKLLKFSDIIIICASCRLFILFLSFSSSFFFFF